MSANEPRKFVVKKRDPAKIAEEQKASRRSVGDILAAQVPGLAGLFLIATGLFVMLDCGEVRFNISVCAVVRG